MKLRRIRAIWEVGGSFQAECWAAGGKKSAKELLMKTAMLNLIGGGDALKTTDTIW